jgi:hypothetical protein
MSTTTTTKKLVYQQDPDGVFRLKKVNQNPTQSHRPHRSAPQTEKSAADYINELAECSFQLQGDSATPKSSNTTSNHSPTSSIGSCDSIHPLPAVASQTSHRFKNFQFASVGTKMSSFKLPSFAQNMSFHFPSFLVGVFLSSFCFAFKAQLFRALYIVVTIVIFVVVLAIAVGGLAWYNGVFSPRELISTFLQPSQTSIVSNLQTTKDGQSNHYSHPSFSDDEGSINSQDMGPTDTKAHLLSSKPELSQDQYESVYVQPFVLAPRTTTYKSQSKDRIPNSRRGSKTQHSSSSPELIQHQRQRRKSDNKSWPINDARGSVDGSLPIPELNGLPMRVSQPSSPTRESQKVIKVNSKTHQELPLINPLTLRCKLEDTPNIHDITRSDTLFSNKSVLGTRANYSKFLANVHEQDAN